MDVPLCNLLIGNSNSDEIEKKKNEKMFVCVMCVKDG